MSPPARAIRSRRSTSTASSAAAGWGCAGSHAVIRVTPAATTRFARQPDEDHVTLRRLRSSLARLAPFLPLIAIALIVAACAGGPVGSPGASGVPAVTPTPQAAIPLVPANPDN